MEYWMGELKPQKQDFRIGYIEARTKYLFKERAFRRKIKSTIKEIEQKDKKKVTSASTSTKMETNGIPFKNMKKKRKKKVKKSTYTKMETHAIPFKKIKKKGGHLKNGRNKVKTYGDYIDNLPTTPSSNDDSQLDL
eukprot:545167_1